VYFTQEEYKDENKSEQTLVGTNAENALITNNEKFSHKDLKA
jgi:hypothetical protein